jgi:hypothetical protein
MVYQLMFLRTFSGNEPSVAALEVAGRAFDSLVAAVQRAMVAGVIVEGPLTETAQLIWSSIHGWVALELLGIGMIEDEDSGFDRVCKTMLRGLRPQSEASESRRRRCRVTRDGRCASEDLAGPDSSGGQLRDTSGRPRRLASGSSRSG